MELQDVEKLRRLELIGSTSKGAPAKEQAEQLVASIADERLRRYAESRLASFFVEVGEIKAAEDLARRMAQTSRHSPAAFVYAKLAEKKATEDRRATLAYLQRAEEAALADADVYTRSATQERIVRAYASLGQWDHAQRIAREIEVVSDRVASMCVLAEKAAASAGHDLALELAGKATMLAERAQPGEQAELLDEIARTYFSLGDRDRAHATWTKAASKALASSFDTSQLLLGICAAFMSLGDQKAARTLAANIRNETRREQALVVTGGG